MSENLRSEIIFSFLAYSAISVWFRYVETPLEWKIELF